MRLTSDELSHLQDLEESLWRAETRWDLSFQEKVFAPDFFEFGRGGRRYQRAEMIRPSGDDIPANLPLKDFRIHAINEVTVLITYISELRGSQLERANRSSLWSKTQEGWKLRFHQGTPTL